MTSRVKSRGAAGSNRLYWLAAAIFGGVAATYAYVKSGPTLDKGLSVDERQAIRFALLSEKIPETSAILPVHSTEFSACCLALADKSRTLSGSAPATPGAPSAPGAPNVSPPKSLLGGLTPSRGAAARVSGVYVGNVWDDIESIPGAAADAASNVGNALVHPADTASGAWHAVTHPADSFTDFGNGLVDALHLIPGMDEAGELLKKFGRTAVGEWCFRVLATVGYYAMAPCLGAQLAAVSFALPGAVKAESFVALGSKKPSHDS